MQNQLTAEQKIEKSVRSENRLPNCSEDKIKKFLEVYSGYEGVWNIKHSDYVNKNEREIAMNNLLRTDRAWVVFHRLQFST